MFEWAQMLPSCVPSPRGAPTWDSHSVTWPEAISSLSFLRGPTEFQKAKTEGTGDLPTTSAPLLRPRSLGRQKPSKRPFV